MGAEGPASSSSGGVDRFESRRSGTVGTIIAMRCRKGKKERVNS